MAVLLIQGHWTVVYAKPYFVVTNDTPCLTFMGKLWCVYCDYFGEKL